MPASAGLVVYRQTTEGWDGVWSHADVGGNLARELVSGADVAKLPGTWTVKIWAPDETLLFTGSLSASILGKCVKLAWTGQMSSGELASFDGLGYRIDAATLAATFQKIDALQSGQ
jgi:hypothetical protein